MRFLLIGVTGLPAMCADRDHALGRGDVRQQRRSGDDVADGVDARLAGALIFVHLDESAVELDARAFEADIFGVRLAAHGDQQRFDVEVFLLAVREGGGEASRRSRASEYFRPARRFRRECRSS